MKIRELLNEKMMSEKEAAELVVKDCKKYLDEIGDVRNNALWRGVISSDGVKYSSGINKIQTNKQRKPRDTNEILHKHFDNWFDEEYGIRFRSKGVFVTNYTRAKIYGNPMMFFPIGNYSYIWSEKYGDLYSSWYKFYPTVKTKEEELKDYNSNNFEKLVKTFLDKGKWQFNKGLEQISDYNFTPNTDVKKFEAMFYCDEFYLVDNNKYPNFYHYLEKAYSE